MVSGSYDQTLRLWDTKTGQPIGKPITGHLDRVNSVAFSPDGSRFVSASDDMTLRLWDAKTGDPIVKPITGHTNRINSVAFSPDGSRIVSGSGNPHGGSYNDSTLRLWDANTGLPIGKPIIGHTDGFLALPSAPTVHA